MTSRELQDTLMILRAYKVRHFKSGDLEINMDVEVEEPKPIARDLRKENAEYKEALEWSITPPETFQEPEAPAVPIEAD